MERLDKFTTFISRPPKSNLENTLQNHRESLEDTLHSTKVIRTTFLDSRIDKLEQRMLDAENGTSKKFKKLLEKIEVLKVDVAEDVKRGEAAASEQLTRFLKKRAEQLSGFERELAGRRQQEENVIRILEQQIASGKTDIQREILDRSRAFSEMKKAFEVEMVGLNDGVRAETATAAASVNSMSNRFGSELDIAYQTLQVELGNRADLARAVIDMKSDIQSRAKNELEIVSAARKQSHADIQSMLEMALTKVNQGV